MADPLFGLPPDSDNDLGTPGSNTWTIVGGGTTEFSALADASDDTYLQGTTASIPVHTYGLTDINPPAGATVSKVDVVLRAQRVKGGSIAIVVRLVMPNGTLSSNKTWNLQTAGIKDHTFAFTNSRPGGGSWTTADFVGMQVRLSYSGATPPVDLRVYRYQVQVSLDPDTLPTPTIVSSTHTDVTANSVRLESVVNPGGYTSQYPLYWTFEYDVPAPPISPDPESTTTGSLNTTLSTVVGGLAAGGVYGFRVRLHKGDEVYTYGPTQNYSTLAADAPILML